MRLAMKLMENIDVMPMSLDPDQYNMMANTQSRDLGKMAAEMKQCPAYGDIVAVDADNNANMNRLSVGSSIAGVIIPTLLCYALSYNY